MNEALKILANIICILHIYHIINKNTLYFASCQDNGAIHDYTGTNLNYRQNL